LLTAIAGSALALAQSAPAPAQRKAAPAAERKAGSLTAKEMAELAQDQLMRAMVTESQRVHHQLGLYGVAPYFLDVTVDDGENLSLNASFGAALAPRHARFRLQFPSVRVGSPVMDNTGYIGSDYSTGTRFDSDLMALDNDLLSLRTELWLSFDRAYKTAAEALGRKQAALNYYTSHDRPPDFTPAAKCTLIHELKKPVVDETRWGERTRALSAVFRNRPGVITADSGFSWSAGTIYYVSSEGSGARVPDHMAMLRLRATAALSEGGEVHNGFEYVALEPAALPGDAELKSAALKAADDLQMLAKAPAGSAYTGPVLFEAYASAQLFAEVFGQELAVPRKPVAEQGRAVPMLESALENKLGSRVLPTFLSIRDDATLRQWRGAPLAGFYEIDMEGVTPTAVTLVEKGLLKNYLTTRQPIQNGAASNGHARLPGPFGAKTARPGNLFVEASETAPEARLRQQLIELIQQQKKPYGLVVRRMDFPSQAPLNEIREMAQRQARSGGSARLYSAPQLIYRLYADGHEELVRGLRLRGFGVKAFRDILAAGDQPALFSYVENGAPMALHGAGAFIVGCSTAAPAVLFEELELEPATDETARPPLVPPPPAQ
jgi:hypothetical protein